MGPSMLAKLHTLKTGDQSTQNLVLRESHLSKMTYNLVNSKKYTVSPKKKDKGTESHDA